MKTVFVNAAVLVGFSITALFAQANPNVQKITYAQNLSSHTLVEGAAFGDMGGSVLSWDDFEAQPLNTNMKGLTPIEGHTWGTIFDYGGQGVAINNQYAISGNKSVKIDWSADGSEAMRAFGWAGKGPYDQLYFTYWRRMEGNYITPGTMNHKQFYVYGNGTQDGLPQLILMMPAGERCWGINGNYDAYSFWGLSSEEANNITSPRVCWEDTSNKFNRWEVFVKLNQPATVSNGILQMRVDGKLVINNQHYPARNVAGNFTDFRLGHMAHGFESTAKAWFDDVYIATTQARIEVCNSNVYENCTIKHIQHVKPGSWTDTSISVDLRNVGAFKEMNSYLYVIDKNGNPSNPVLLSIPTPPPQSSSSANSSSASN